jgi:hypothetical protein
MVKCLFLFPTFHFGVCPWRSKVDYGIEHTFLVLYSLFLFDSLGNYRCILNKPAARWANVPIPTQESLINFLAMFSHVTNLTMGGQLSVDIENIVFCPASSTVANTEYSAESEGSSPSAKRHKYSSYAPARVPVSSSSNTLGDSAAISAPSDSIASSSTPATLNTRVTHSGYSNMSIIISISVFIFKLHV